jgi:hypothetical protein
MSAKALSLFVTEHYPYARCLLKRFSCSLHACCFPLTPPEKDQELRLYA